MALIDTNQYPSYSTDLKYSFKVHLRAVAWPEMEVKWNDVFFSLDNSMGYPETCKITCWGFMSMCSPPPVKKQREIIENRGLKNIISGLRYCPQYLKGCLNGRQLQ